MGAPCLITITGTAWPWFAWASEASFCKRFSPTWYSTVPNLTSWSPSCRPSSAVGDASAISSTTAKGMLPIMSTSMELGESLRTTLWEVADGTALPTTEFWLFDTPSFPCKWGRTSQSTYHREEANFLLRYSISISILKYRS